MFTTTSGSGSLLLYANLNSTARLRRHNLLHLQPIISLSLPPLKTSLKQPLKPFSHKPHHFRPLTFSSLNPNFPQFPPHKPQFISNFTKTLAALFSLIPQIITTQFLNLKTRFLTPSPQFLETLQYLHDYVVCTVGPLFFTFVQGVPSGLINSPLTAIASGIAKWLDIYSGVLMVRVLLSWFPNMPWERQPFSAIRDLTDPFLSLCRKIIPPINNAIDVSPLLGFAVLGMLGSILGGAKA